MTLLPVATRELSVASRKKASYRVRVLAAVIAVLIGMLMMIPSVVAGVPSNRLGVALFSTLTWLLFFGCLSAGLFLTSDAISEEKREGTLGFLFLTDLTGADVLLGKLTATLVRGAYAVLAVFPVLGITLLMGGVTGAQFWKSSLAIVNALLCSLAAGLFVSTVARKAGRAFAWTLILIMAWSLVGPLINLAYSESTGRPGLEYLNWTSPAHAFTAANAWTPGTSFAGALAGSLAVAALLLAAGAYLVRRTWQEKADAIAAPAGPGRVRARNERGERLRARFMDPNPVVWLALREKRQASFAWVLAISASIAILVFFFVNEKMAWVFWSTAGGVISFFFLLAVAAYAPRSFNDARRNGMFELLAATPMTPSDIVHGHWKAMQRHLAAPCLMLALCIAIGTFQSYTAVMGKAGEGGNRMLLLWGAGGALALLSGVSAGLALLADAAALCWFGMWTGFTSKNAMFAGLKNYVFVQLLPWFLISFVAGIGAAFLVFPRLSGWNMGAEATALVYPLVMLALRASLQLTKDMFFIYWARARLLKRFREEAARVGGWSAAGMILVPPVIKPHTAPPRQ